MGLYFRKRVPFGPFHINLSRSGVSTSFTAGRFTVNPKRRRLWVNLPGPFYWTSTARRRSR